MKKNVKIIAIFALVAVLMLLCACTQMHQHQFSTGFTSDDSSHWQVALCHPVVTTQIEKHTFDGGVRNGNQVDYTCTVCNHTTTTPFGNHSHNLTFVEGTLPTLDSTGIVDHYTCSVCGCLFADQSGQTHLVNSELTADKLTVVGLDIVTPPSVTNYQIGQSFDTTGMKVEATLSNGTTMEVDDYTVSPSVFSQPGRSIAPTAKDIRLSM